MAQTVTQTLTQTLTHTWARTAAQPARRAIWPAAVSPIVALAVWGPRRRVRVLGAFRTCLYVGYGEHADVLAVVTSDGLSLPIGLRLGATSSEIATVGWGVQPGDAIEIGEGRVSLPRADVVAAREQRTLPVRAWPPVSRVLTSRGAPALENCALDAELVSAADRLAAAALAGMPVVAPVRRLVGAGRGLTPAGDDVLCGVVLTLRAAGRLDAVALLGNEIRRAFGGTTSISAALLRAACDGHALPDVLRLVDGIGAGAHSSPALKRVLKVGYSSGRDLVAGLAGACGALCHG